MSEQQMYGLQPLLERLTLAWRNTGVQWRLHIFIQFTLAAFFISSQNWIIQQFDEQGIADVKKQALNTSDGLINGLNLLMVTGRISDPDNRELLVKKMASSENVRSLRVIRADQVSAQFGPGLANEHPVDSEELEVIKTGAPSYTRKVTEDGAPVLRVLIPYVVSNNFRGTNCLSCHNVKPGSVNGAAAILMDLSRHELLLTNFKRWLWSGMFLFQLGVSLIIALFIDTLLKRHIAKPVQKLKSTIEEIHQSGDLSLRVNISNEHPDIDKIAHTFNAFISNLEFVTEGRSLMAKVVESSEEAILITDQDKNIVFINAAFTHTTGYSENEVLGKNPCLLKSGVHDQRFYKHMWEQIQTYGSWQGEIINRRKNGQHYPEWQSITVVKNSQGDITNYVSIFLDITKRKASEAHIQRMANYDALTGLANRNLLNDRLNQALSTAHRQHTRLVVMFLDLDNFKDINDGYGHAVGDAVLQRVAERLLACVREGDTVARQGGDEFILMLTDIDSYGAIKVAEKLLYSVSAPYQHESMDLFISVSIGIAVYPEDGEHMESLLKNADSAMYVAKKDGRNCYRMFTQKMNRDGMRRVKLQNALRYALHQNEFEVYFQPQLHLGANQVTGMEALLRWRMLDGGMISPAEFIPIAEENGLIIAIGEWVLTKSCMEAKHWHDMGHRVKVSVNVSGRQFREANFDETVEAILRTSGLDPGFLELEMTESILIEQSENMLKMLTKLKALGVKIALDDFGTGYSSLSYIKRFPIDRIKIDQSFVRDILDDAGDAAIVDAIIYIARTLNIEVIAEGVESIEQLNFLRAHHCKDIQGYYVSKPLPAAQLLQMLSQHMLLANEYRPQGATTNNTQLMQRKPENNILIKQPVFS